jgi:hypothetical protein
MANVGVSVVLCVAATGAGYVLAQRAVAQAAMAESSQEEG